MAVEGLSHITLVVRDIARSLQLMRGVLGATITYASGDETFSLSREVFLDVGGVWLVLMEGEALPTRSYNHIAFKIAEDDFDACLTRIEASGVEMLPPRPRVEGEGRSIYFHDYDNHLFELHTGTLAVRLARCAKGKAP